MRTTYDFTPLFRSTVGFDRVFNLLENAGRTHALDNWPPYDIEKTGQDTYRISIAAAGFSPDELTVTAEPNLLVICGAKDEDDGVRYLHRGIPGCSFERRFELADFVKVREASLENGLLTVDLVREVPEELQPRRIRIEPQATTSAPTLKHVKADAA